MIGTPSMTTVQLLGIVIGSLSRGVWMTFYPKWELKLKHVGNNLCQIFRLLLYGSAKTLFYNIYCRLMLVWPCILDKVTAVA